MITAEKKKARVRGKKCHARAMMHSEAGEAFKLNIIMWKHHASDVRLFGPLSRYPSLSDNTLKKKALGKRENTF